jgi:hypothetical protein
MIARIPVRHRANSIGTGIASVQGVETDLPIGAPETAVLEALQATEPTQASAALSALADRLPGLGADVLDLTAAWQAFVRLLDRRGYFVDTPDELATSLKEIEEIGAGFDLYDLAQSLARYDSVRSRCRRLGRSHCLPELKGFAPTRTHSHGRKEK